MMSHQAQRWQSENVIWSFM